MADTTARAGVASVSIRGIRAIEDQVRAAAPSAAGDTLHDEVSAVVDRARRAWPVATGRSLRGLAVGRSAGSSRVSVVVRNAVPYAGDVRIAGHDEPAWRELVEVPVEDARRSLEAAVARQIEREVQARIDRAG